MVMRAKFIKDVCVILAVLLSSYLFQGCGSNEMASSTKYLKEQQLRETDRQNIRIWARGSGPDPGIRAIIEKFNSSQTSIKVQYEFFGENYASLVQLALAAKTAPDVFEANTGLTVVGLAKVGYIISIDDLLSEELKSSLHPDTLKQKDLYYEGKIYSIPTRISGYRLLYNKDLFRKSGLDPDKPPKTLEDMRKYSAQIAKAGNGEFYGFGLALGVEEVWNRVIDPINIAMGEGGRYGFDYKTGRFDMSYSKKLFSYYLDLMRDGSIFPGYATMGIDPLRANFSRGKVGMYIDGNWLVANYAVQLKTDADWDCVPLPVFAGKGTGKYWAEGGVNYVISKTSKCQTEAKKFYRALLDGQVAAQKYMPVPRTVIAANKEDAIPVNEMNLKGVKYSFETGDLSIYPVEPHRFFVLRGDNRDKVFTKLFIEASETGTKIDNELDAAIKDLDTRYNQALDMAVRDGLIDINDIKIENYDLFKR